MNQLTEPVTAPPVSPAKVVGNSLMASLPPGIAAILIDPASLPRKKGETTVPRVILLDSNGKVIPYEGPLPLNWSSLKPEELRVDGAGHVTAERDNPDNNLVIAVLSGLGLSSARYIDSPSSTGGGGGGGASSPALPAPAPMNHPPVITLLNASTTQVIGFGQMVRLTADATDQDQILSDGDFSWNCAGNQCMDFSSGTGRTVYWRTPQTAGNYLLRLSVTDGLVTVSQDVEISVTGGSSTILVNP